jgi:hypothetical protein
LEILTTSFQLVIEILAIVLVYQLFLSVVVGVGVAGSFHQSLGHSEKSLDSAKRNFFSISKTVI